MSLSYNAVHETTIKGANMEFKTFKTNDISIRAAIMGSGPLVILVHGWPELWYSWRHQIEPITSAGYKVIAIDVRGYGGSDKPHPVASYSMQEMMDDIERMMREDDIHIFRAQNPHLYIPYDTYYNTYNIQPIYYPLYRQDYDLDYDSVPNDYHPIMFYTQKEQDYYQGSHMKRRRLAPPDDSEVDNEVDDTGSIS